ncbi:hypothetical protein M8312_10315 [Sphingomonas sp. KRR8]|uniref:hypothetical protein n=1 Tax=Sphingomonas sp. KRR8 TaxID=2942996 RepID=UPI0020218DA0|nr:hypothetical protein [Sphingomonas sp. KRR8]URD60180.1 hypothetical protein M8312_10315 [Sphingomonas sp. KRR8]
MIRNSLVRLVPVALLIATAGAGTAQAATDGSLGATSTGLVNINASIAARVQISGLSDVTIASVDPTVAESHPQDVCVWSNTAGHKYNIKATGSGASGAFTLASGTLPVVNYTVEWNQLVAKTSGTALTAGTALTGQASAATTPTCASGTKSASLVVKMDTTNLTNMQAGATYGGVLTLVVAPE